MANPYICSSYSEVCVATVFASLGRLSGIFGEIRTGGAALRVLILSRLIPPSVSYHPMTLSVTTEEAVSLSLRLLLRTTFALWWTPGC
jgi:hypothetical protein